MAPIPLTLIGILPAHALSGAFFTATSMIGMIALAGIIGALVASLGAAREPEGPDEERDEAPVGMTLEWQVTFPATAGMRTAEVTLPGFRHDVMAATFVLFLTSPAFGEIGEDLARGLLEARQVTDAEIEAKFDALAEPVLSEAARGRLKEAVWKLETLGSVTELMDLCRSDR